MRLATSTFSDLPDERMLYVDGAASLLDDAHGLTLEHAAGAAADDRGEAAAACGC